MHKHEHVQQQRYKHTDITGTNISGKHMDVTVEQKI